METAQDNVFIDDEITPQLLKLIGEAKREVILVSPYWHLWGHLTTAIERAVSRGVKVSALVRREGDKLGGDGEKGAHAVEWLLEAGVSVLALDRLHAKIYMNEQNLILSSMNLTESSAMNSSEIAVLVRNPQTSARVRAYVNQRLLTEAKPVRGPGLLTRVAQKVSEARAVYRAMTAGHCIRCGRDLYFNPDKPLCDPCYDTWSEYENEDYEEEFCHMCGKPEETTYAKPLCGSCYRQSVTR